MCTVNGYPLTRVPEPLATSWWRCCGQLRNLLDMELAGRCSVRRMGLEDYHQLLPVWLSASLDAKIYQTPPQAPAATDGALPATPSIHDRP